MRERLKKAGENFIHCNNFFYTLLRSSLASQTSGWIDFGVSFVMFTWIGFKPVFAAMVGAFAGGVANCLINYRFTFRNNSSPWKAVAIKYFLVWVGSLSLNSFGTQGLYWVLTNWHWLETLGFRPSGYFTAARLFVALLVSWCWNFMLQRYFVYRSTRFDKCAISCANFLFHGRFKVMASDITKENISFKTQDK